MAIAAQAVKEALQWFEISKKRTLLFSIPSFIVWAALLVFIHTERHGWEQAYWEAEVIISGIYATLIFFGIVFLVLLIVVPAKFSLAKDRELSSVKERHNKEIMAVTSEKDGQIRQLNEEITSIKKKIAPAFIVELGESTQPPFFSLSFTDIPHRSFPNARGIHCIIHTINIRLGNTGIKSIEDCKVALIKVEPWADVLQGGNFPFTNSFLLTTQELYVPIVSYVRGNIGRDGPVRLETINAQETYLPDIERVLTIHVSGKDVAGFTKRCRIWTEATLLKMAMLED